MIRQLYIDRQENMVKDVVIERLNFRGSPEKDTITFTDNNRTSHIMLEFKVTDAPLIIATIQNLTQTTIT